MTFDPTQSLTAGASNIIFHDRWLTNIIDNAGNKRLPSYIRCKTEHTIHKEGLSKLGHLAPKFTVDLTTDFFG